MKKKIVFAVATGFFAVATVFNMNLLQRNNNESPSLNAVIVMAQAQSENGGGGGGGESGGNDIYCYLIHVGWKEGVPLVRCSQTAYQDPSGVGCSCWSGTRPLSL